MIKKITVTALAMCLGVGIAHANTPTEKQKIVDLVKSSDDDLKVYSSDGKRFYQKEISINDKGGLDVRVREKYLPAITDGVTKTHRTSYFGITPQTLRYIGKIGKATNAVGIGLLMLDVLGTGLDDYNVTPEGNVNYTVHGQGKYCTAYASQRLCNDDVQTLCQNWLELANSRNNNRYVFADSVKGTESHCLVYGGTSRFNGNAGSAVMKSQPERKVMSEREFDEAVRALAKAGNINAKQVITDAGKDEIADGKHDADITRLADDITSDTAQDEPQPDNPPSDDTTTKPDDETSPKDDTADKDKADDTTKDDTKATDPTTNNNGNFELPPFCEWAGVVCDFISWVRQEPLQEQPPQNVPKKGVGDIPELADVDRYKERVNFDGQCPTGQISFGINGTQYSYVMPYTHFCQLLEQLAPWLLAFTYLSTAYFIVSNL